MTAILSHTPPQILRTSIDANARTLPRPSTPSQASLWMQLAAHRIIGREKLSQKERNTVLSIALDFESAERTNAFWPMMAAVLYDDGGQDDKAIEAWSHAANCVTWDDHQTERLLADRQRMIDATGVKQSWQLAYLYYSRSDDVAHCINDVARTILSQADYDSVPGLKLRYETLLNGNVLAEHAHSTRSSVYAMDMIDYVTYPSEKIAAQGYNPSPKLVYWGQERVLSNLTKVLHQPDWTDTATKIFIKNEGFRALTVHASNAERASLMAYASVAFSAVPSAAVALAAVGPLVWVLGRLVSWLLAGEKRVNPYLAAAIALGLGAVAQILTGYFPAAIGAALCGAFLIVGPDKSRQARPSDLGPLFGLTTVVLGLVCSTMLVAYLVGKTTGAGAILPMIGVPPEYFDEPMWLGLAVVSFCMVFVISPLWAVAQRIGTPYVLSLSLTRLGVFIGALGLSLSIVLGPLSVYADRRLESTLNELVTNEPIHYYLQK